tara:strand:+ start:209 stop:673 length:465 start_codon:yes stop_codon:yes gene_type:complete
MNADRLDQAVQEMKFTERQARDAIKAAGRATDITSLAADEARCVRGTSAIVEPHRVEEVIEARRQYLVARDTSIELEALAMRAKKEMDLCMQVVQKAAKEEMLNATVRTAAATAWAETWETRVHAEVSEREKRADARKERRERRALRRTREVLD